MEGLTDDQLKEIMELSNLINIMIKLKQEQKELLTQVPISSKTESNRSNNN